MAVILTVNELEVVVGYTYTMLKEDDDESILFLS